MGEESRERRKYSRFDMDNYPGSIVSSIGQKIRVSIGNISMSGALAKCSVDSSKTIVGDKVGFFNPNTSSTFNLHAIFPQKNNLKKLDAVCKIIYIFRAADEKDPEHAIYIGLKIISHNGNSENVLIETLQERKLPKLQPAKN